MRRQGVDDEIQIISGKQGLVVLVTVAPEALFGLFAPFRKQIGNGDDLVLAGGLLKPGAVNGQTAAALTKNADTQGAGSAVGSAGCWHGGQDSESEGWVVRV